MSTLEIEVGAKSSLAESAYANIKVSIFDFEMLPGDRFSESGSASSRTKRARMHSSGAG
jgi:hypothetical protein